MSFTITNLTGFATLQDRGRSGQAHLAIPTSGAFDILSHDLANRIVGNSPDCATVELLRPHLEIEANSDLDFAITGAPVDIRINGHITEMNSHIHAPSGSNISIKNVGFGMRSYLSIRGGISAEIILGSQSYDELSRIGNPPLVSGQILAIGNNTNSEIPHNYAVIPGIQISATQILNVFKGPRWDFFNSSDFLNSEFIVSSKCNRVGVRLEGEPLRWDTERRLPSEGVALGSIQVPVDGLPIIFGPDHPTTGGYPVIAVVAFEEISRVAQLAPGTRIRFSVH